MPEATYAPLPGAGEDGTTDNPPATPDLSKLRRDQLLSLIDQVNALVAEDADLKKEIPRITGIPDVVSSADPTIFKDEIIPAGKDYYLVTVDRIGHSPMFLKGELIDGDEFRPGNRLERGDLEHLLRVGAVRRASPVDFVTARLAVAPGV